MVLAPRQIPQRGEQAVFADAEGAIFADIKPTWLPFVRVTSVAESVARATQLGGKVLNGKYAGGTASTINYQTSNGLMTVETAQVVALTMAAPVPATPPPPVMASGPVTLPAGTLLLVRMMDSISSRDAAGANFTTRLEYNLVVNGVVAAPAGSIIYGKVQSSSQARRAFGRSTLDIRLAQLVVGGSPVPLSTSAYAEAGEASIKKVAVAAGVGAVIGNNVNGGGHGGGAAWGAGVAMLRPGQTLTIPPGALLEFTLEQPVTFQAGR